jgi:hypothetical protein
VNPSLERGKRAEREVTLLLAEHGGWVTRRRLAGRSDDVGDLEGLPDCTVQVKSYADITRGLREAIDELPGQVERAGTRFGAAFIRRPGARYVVVMDVPMFCSLLREATS